MKTNEIPLSCPAIDKTIEYIDKLVSHTLYTEENQKYCKETAKLAIDELEDVRNINSNLRDANHHLELENSELQETINHLNESIINYREQVEDLASKLATIIETKEQLEEKLRNIIDYERMEV